eukprot:scaffold266534_cov32-Tisochrysis_lutea.AAC.1
MPKLVTTSCMVAELLPGVAESASTRKPPESLYSSRTAITYEWQPVALCASSTTKHTTCAPHMAWVGLAAKVRGSPPHDMPPCDAPPARQGMSPTREEASGTPGPVALFCPHLAGELRTVTACNANGLADRANLLMNERLGRRKESYAPGWEPAGQVVHDDRRDERLAHTRGQAHL